MVGRRKFLAGAGAGSAAIFLSELDPVRAQPAKGDQRVVKPELANVKALVFDTFGTVVDWRTSLIEDLTAEQGLVTCETVPVTRQKPAGSPRA